MENSERTHEKGLWFSRVVRCMEISEKNAFSMRSHANSGELREENDGETRRTNGELSIGDFFFEWEEIIERREGNNISILSILIGIEKCN